MTLGQAGTVLAERYQLVRLVGSAIDGEVWQGHDRRLARSVTVRLAEADPDAPGDDPGVQPLITRLSQVNDPGVAAVYDVGVDGGLRYAVGEWIHGRTLSQIFATGRQPWQRAGDWGQQVGTALDSLHTVGIVHGTLTAESIAIQDDRRAKIIDLGLVARAAEDDSGAEDEDGPAAAPDSKAARTTVLSPDDRTRALPAANRDREPAGGSAQDVTTALPHAERTRALPAVDAGKDPGAGSDGLTKALPHAERTRALPSLDGPTTALGPADRTRVLPPVRAQAPAEASDDVYALGAVLWWAVTGVPLAYATTTSAGPDPAALREAGAPPEFIALLLRMLAADPDARPTAAAAADQFATVQAIPRADDTMVGPQLIAATQSLAQVPETMTVRPYDEDDDRPVPTRGRDEPDSRRTWAIVAGVLALAVAGVLIGLLLANRHSNNPGVGTNGTPLPTSTSTSAPVVLPDAPTTVATTQQATVAPTTVAPTTVAPTTVAPTTVAPTTPPPVSTTPPIQETSTPTVPTTGNDQGQVLTP